MARSALMFSSILLERYSIFLFFLNYWDAFTDHILHDHAYEMQKENYGKLSEIWTKNLWDKNELDYICEKMNSRVDYLNPNLFFGKEQGYIDHVKTCYLLRNF